MDNNKKEVAYPYNKIQIAPGGIIVNMILGPGLSITTVLDESTANEMCRQWVTSRKEVRKQLELVRNIDREHNRLA